MDFHGLSRKELQGLCKKNKIPANMTNVAMADALTALEKVEGLDEVLNPPTSELQQSPPRTACKSTRRKPVLAEPESSQTLTCTRRATRRTVVAEADQGTKFEAVEGGDQENVNANLLETPALPSGRTRGRAVTVRKKAEVSFVEGLEETIGGEKKKNLLQTPAVKGSRRRNVETKNEEKSTVRVYSTRRSVRLLEQSMEELNLKEKEITAVVEDDGCCKATEEVEEENDASGIDMTVVPVESSRNNNIDSEFCPNLAKSLDNASEMKQEPVEAKVGAVDCCSETVEKLSLSEEQVSEDVAMKQELGEENKDDESEGYVEKFSLSEEEDSEEVPMEQELGEESKVNVCVSEDADAQEAASENGDQMAIVSGIDEEDENVRVQDVVQESTGKNTNAFEIDDHKRDHSELDALESENIEDATDNINESSDENESEVLCPEIYDKQVEEEYDANKTPSVECDDEEVPVDVSVAEEDNFVVPCLQETPAPANQVSLSGAAEDQTLSDVYIEQAAEFCAALVPASPMEKLPAAKYRSPYRPLVSGGGISKASPFADGTIQGQFPRPAGSATRKSAVKNQIMADAIDSVDKENILSLKMEEPKEEKVKKFDDMSLRQLKKMFKGMTIDKKKNSEEENNGTKVENKRVALQALPDN